MDIFDEIRETGREIYAPEMIYSSWCVSLKARLVKYSEKHLLTFFSENEYATVKTLGVKWTFWQFYLGKFEIQNTGDENVKYFWLSTEPLNQPARVSNDHHLGWSTDRRGSIWVNDLPKSKCPPSGVAVGGGVYINLR